MVHQGHVNGGGVKRKRFARCGPQCGRRAYGMRGCQSALHLVYNHLTNSLYSIGGRGVNGRVRTRLANNHLVALRLIEFEVVNSGPFFNVFKFSRYSVRV